MITNVILNGFYVLLALILSLLPSSSGLPSEITNAFTQMAGYISTYSYLINVDALFGGVVAVVGFELSLLTVKGVFWLIRTVRGSGS